MKIKTVISQANGIISITLQALFVGDSTDANDKALIAAFGDPEVNIAGTFIDPSDSSFQFQFPTTEKWVGITTELAQHTARFMLALPQALNPNQPAPIQGEMDCVTPNPSRAATVWASIMGNATDGRIKQAMTSLRAQSLVPPIPDVTI